MTALVDMHPRVLRKKNRREVLILGVSVTSFLVGLVMLTEVRVWVACRWGPGGEEEPRQRTGRGAGGGPGEREGRGRGRGGCCGFQSLPLAFRAQGIGPFPP